MRARYILSVAIALITLLFTFSAFAGDPGGPGTAPESTFSYTLEDIYQRLNTGAVRSQRNFTEPSTGPGAGTGHTLNEVMAQAPVADSANGATPAEVLTGATYWSLRTDGTWGAQTGIMPNNGAPVVIPSTTDQTIAAGYHDGLGYVQGDADLETANIRSGVSIFGVSGDPYVVNTSSGDAQAGEIRQDRIAWVDGIEVTGAMPDNGAVTIVPATTDQTIPSGYHDGLGYVPGDDDLAPWNIRSGVTIFGVTGTCYRLPATGQTTVYAPGDDGDLRIGCKPFIGPCSGADGCNFNRTDLPWGSSWGDLFTDNGDGTVTDELTGLIWLKNASCYGYRSWTEALSDAATLNNGECGLSDGSAEGDWRLPNSTELRSLIDPGQDNPSLPRHHPFTASQWHIYWSSSSGASNAWDVDMANGHSGIFGKDSYSRSVWPVRGGQ